MRYILVSAILAISLCSVETFAGKDREPEPRSPIMTRAKTHHHRNPLIPGAPIKVHSSSSTPSNPSDTVRKLFV